VVRYDQVGPLKIKTETDCNSVSCNYWARPGESLKGVKPEGAGSWRDVAVQTSLEQKARVRAINQGRIRFRRFHTRAIPPDDQRCEQRVKDRHIICRCIGFVLVSAFPCPLRHTTFNDVRTLALGLVSSLVRTRHSVGTGSNDTRSAHANMDDKWPNIPPLILCITRPGVSVEFKLQLKGTQRSYLSPHCTAIHFIPNQLR
jgi:hypothetical protein